MGFLAELDKLAAEGQIGPTKPKDAELPEVRTYNLVAMRCDRCGHEEYRRPKFVKGLTDRRMDEVRLREDCGQRVVRVYKYPENEMTWCHGEMLTIPGFEHDLLRHDFEVDLETLTNGRQKGTERISSLHEVRALENRSLQLAANGEGEPLIFRKLSQDRRNNSKHTLTDSKYERGRAKPRPSRRTLSGLPITVTATEEPKD